MFKVTPHCICEACNFWYEIISDYVNAAERTFSFFDMITLQLEKVKIT